MYIALLSSLVLFRMSGRDIRDVCQQAERSWASKVKNLRTVLVELDGLVSLMVVVPNIITCFDR